MRPTVIFVFTMALCLLVIPMLALNQQITPGESANVPVHTPVQPQPTPDESLVSDSEDFEDNEDIIADYEYESLLSETIPVSENSSVQSFKILDASTGKVNEVSVRDFVRGAVAAEMPASFHSEALKAQAVAAHTFALHSHIEQEKSPNPDLKGADFEADPSNMKVYITETTAKEFYGEDMADVYWNKICEAADSVCDYILEYDDEPIVAAYHAISAGITEDASNVWTGVAPYLLSVESEGDILAPGFETTVTLDRDEVKSVLMSEFPNIELPKSESEWFSEPVRSDSGYVTEIEVGDQTVHGKDVRRIFDLRSHNFEISYDGGEFVFTVAGYGHGVGLSQYGADFLARQGETFDRILKTYYTGATLKSVA